MGFDVLSILGQQSVGETETAVKDFCVEMIPLEDIAPNEQNFYTVEEIEPLAKDILSNGLMHNVVVQQRGDDGKFKLISGERRFRAFCMLRETEGDGYGKIPAVIDTETNPLMVQLKLISANAMSRVLSDYEKAEQAARISDIVKELKAQGAELTGRTREITATILEVSTAQAGRLEKISRDLVPEVKEQFKTGDIGVTRAYEVATLPPAQQREAIEKSKPKAHGPKGGDREHLVEKKPARTWTEGFDNELESVALCLEHWNELAKHTPEYELLKRLLLQEAAMRRKRKNG